MHESLKLSFDTLYSTKGLHEIDCEFLKLLEIKNHEIFTYIKQARNEQQYDAPKVIEASILLEQFISSYFNIEKEIDKTKEKHLEHSIISKCKKIFVQKKANKEPSNFQQYEEAQIILEDILGQNFSELTFAKAILLWIEEKNLTNLNVAEKYILYKIHDSKNNCTLFKLPKKNKELNFESTEHPHFEELFLSKSKIRNGFSLTKPIPTLSQSIDQSNYCIQCHKRNKDSCSKGLKLQNNFIAGCPLKIKISEMNQLKSLGFTIAAFAILMIDNPMCPATGNNICNLCSLSCIFQKQEAVNIPLIETEILECILNLPYGFEIYSLLAKWNPLRTKNFAPKHNSGKNVFICGAGPAGFSIAYYLMQEGHNVFLTDASKIEFIKTNTELILNSKTLFEDLSTRNPSGFGGVSEYGITSRWNKNYLTLIRIMLERNKLFSLKGGILLGGNIFIKQIFEHGFNHLVLATGSGNPTIIDNIKNPMPAGMRTSSDFLMTLQLSGAFLKNSIVNLQILLPAIVIGGGLTAVDTATEISAYYIEQVKKLSHRYELLLQTNTHELIRQNLNEYEIKILDTMLTHASIVKKSKPENFAQLIKQFGGVRVIYRNDIKLSPAYIKNREEIQSAMHEGIIFIGNLKPQKTISDNNGQISNIIFQNVINGSEITFPAKTVISATGTKPNFFFANANNTDAELIQNILDFTKNIELNSNSFIVKNTNLGSITAIGDLHPKYKGSVVEAISSAKASYEQITDSMKNHKTTNKPNLNAFAPKVTNVTKLNKNITEITIDSTFAIKNFKAGQFFKLQNYINNNNFCVDGKSVSIEPLALTGIKNNNTISFIILNNGGSSSIASNLKIGEEVVLMGPSGAPTEIPENENVIFIGGGTGNAVFLSALEAMKNNKCNILYFAGYRTQSDVFKKEYIEQFADTIVWSLEDKSKINTRKHDILFSNTRITDAIIKYSKIYTEKFQKIDRILIAGSCNMMEAVSNIKKQFLNPIIKQKYKTIISTNSPMQCMAQKVCGQCIQKDKNNNFIYTCTNQDQDGDNFDFSYLKSRLYQNNLQEKITKKYIDYLQQKNEE